MASRFEQFVEQETKSPQKKTRTAVVQETHTEKISMKTASHSRPMRVSDKTHELATLIKLSTGESYQQILEEAVMRHIQALALMDPKIKGMQALWADYEKPDPQQTTIGEFLT